MGFSEQPSCLGSSNLVAGTLRVSGDARERMQQKTRTVMEKKLLPFRVLFFAFFRVGDLGGGPTPPHGTEDVHRVDPQRGPIWRFWFLPFIKVVLPSFRVAHLHALSDCCDCREKLRSRELLGSRVWLASWTGISRRSGLTGCLTPIWSLSHFAKPPRDEAPRFPDRLAWRRRRIGGRFHERAMK
jgi:hypothetical protein